MTRLDLRPLSIGEILDRTFTLYREHFVLFFGISAIPHILALIVNLAQTYLRFPGTPSAVNASTLSPSLSVAAGVVALVGAVVGVLVYLLTQGATVTAVSELYLGRTLTIGDSFRRVRGELGNLFGVILLNGLATIAAFICLIIPGIYVMCRLVVCVPAALVENIGPRASLDRSFELTRDNAGRAFLILLLYFALTYAAIALFVLPFTIMMGIMVAKNHPEMLRSWMALIQIGTTLATVLVAPVLTIASAVLYYDLRIRKEAFDLQMMMNPLGGASPTSSSLPSMLT